jgi:hypothetical protein
VHDVHARRQIGLSSPNDSDWKIEKGVTGDIKEREHIATHGSSPAVGAQQAEIQRYLASDGCKIWPGETYIPSGESRIDVKFEQI